MYRSFISRMEFASNRLHLRNGHPVTGWRLCDAFVLCCSSRPKRDDLAPHPVPLASSACRPFGRFRALGE